MSFVDELEEIEAARQIGEDVVDRFTAAPTVAVALEAMMLTLTSFLLVLEERGLVDPDDVDEEIHDFKMVALARVARDRALQRQVVH